LELQEEEGEVQEEVQEEAQQQEEAQALQAQMPQLQV
jgi:hypothetical protein